MPFCLLILISNCLAVNECIQVTINSDNTKSWRVEKWDFPFSIPLYPLTFLISQEVKGCLPSRMVPFYTVEVKSFDGSGISVRLTVVPLASPHQ